MFSHAQNAQTHVHAPHSTNLTVDCVETRVHVPLKVSASSSLYSETQYGKTIVMSIYRYKQGDRPEYNSTLPPHLFTSVYRGQRNTDNTEHMQTWISVFELLSMSLSVFECVFVCLDMFLHARESVYVYASVCL